jgi:hypothetical protein
MVKDKGKFVPVLMTVPRHEDIDTVLKFIGRVKCWFIIILPVRLYGCETWYLTERKEHKLRAYEYEGLRRIFEPKREKITGEWRKLHNELSR